MRLSVSYHFLIREQLLKVVKNVFDSKYFYNYNYILLKLSLFCLLLLFIYYCFIVGQFWRSL